MAGEKLREDIERVLLTTEHRNILEALGSDIFDLIPVLGDITNVTRVMDCYKKGDYMGTALQTADLPGPLSVLPANIATYVHRRLSE